MKPFFMAVVFIGAASGLYAQSVPSNHPGQSNLFRLRQELQQPLDNHAVVVQDVAVEHARKSPAAAVLYSLLLPGLGEWYVDRFDQGKYSLIAEGALWLSYYSYRQYGQWVQDDSRDFAIAHADAAVAGKNDQYFVDLGNFNDTYEYNDKKLIDRTPDRLYDVNAGYYWKWDSESNRREFRTMRVSSERIFNNSKFVIGAVIVNHILSAVNAARLARQYNKELEGAIGSWWLESSIIHNGAKPDGVRLSFLHAL